MTWGTIYKLRNTEGAVYFMLFLFDVYDFTATAMKRTAVWGGGGFVAVSGILLLIFSVFSFLFSRLLRATQARDRISQSVNTIILCCDSSDQSMYCINLGMFLPHTEKFVRVCEGSEETR